MKRASSPSLPDAPPRPATISMASLTSCSMRAADFSTNPTILKTFTRPLTNWSLLYGRVAQLTDRNGILLWKYEQPEMVSNPSLVRLRNYPADKDLVDGNILVVFARNEGPYSYIDSQRNKSTVHSYDFGKPLTKQQFDAFLQNRPPPTIRLPPLSH